VFYADVTGHVDAEPLSLALPDVEKACQTLKVLGSYPRA
jgi:prephenate dehydratase